MESKEVHKPMNSKGAAIFKVMLDDKKAVHEHLQKGGELDEILNKIKLEHTAISAYLKKGGNLENYKKNKSPL